MSFDGSGMGFGMWFFWILFIVIIVVVLKLFTGSDSYVTKPESPLDILKSRYARGEIDEEEFERRKRNLGS